MKNLFQACPQDDALYIPIDCQDIVEKYSKVLLLLEIELAAYPWETRGNNQLLPTSYGSQIGEFGIQQKLVLLDSSKERSQPIILYEEI